MVIGQSDGAGQKAASVCRVAHLECTAGFRRSPVFHESGGLCVSVGYLPHEQLALAAHQAHAATERVRTRSKNDD